MRSLHVDPAMVPAFLKGSYTGRKFQICVGTEMTVPSDAGLWSGGSRDVYSAVDLTNQRAIPIPGQQEAPWSATRREIPVQLKPDFCIVRHMIFRGTDMGLTFYLHPENAAKYLPAPVELSAHEKLVLSAMIGMKASYQGRDRYENSRYYLSSEEKKAFPTREQWDAAKASLIAKGLLNKAGAVTTAGRNAR